MKILNKILSMFGIIFIILVVFVLKEFSFHSNTKTPPTKTSFWKGAEDWGCWFDILEIDSINKIVRIKVYNDYNGETWVDAYYRDINKSIIPFTKKNIENSIFNYDEYNDNIEIRLLDSLYLLKKNEMEQ